MYWGNAKANDARDAHATYDPDQLLVWHFAEENGLPKDSTSYNNNALTPGKRDVNAIIGFGGKLDGTAPIKLARQPDAEHHRCRNLTWQIWVKADAACADRRDLRPARCSGARTISRFGCEAGMPCVAVASATGVRAVTATAPPRCR